MRVFWREHFWRCGRVLLIATLLMCASSVRGQTVAVDTTPSRAIPFDPDKALGTSIDILPAKTFDKVYSDAILKESLSAG
ncbi:MAG TPA: hypothetical protein VNU84_07830, partial [Candidatus Acidoferrum sp.]|nr:hypothetical protein [Candidatus Acidoferrum sp.]